jgi:hypothetical protein
VNCRPLTRPSWALLVRFNHPPFSREAVLCWSRDARQAFPRRTSQRRTVPSLPPLARICERAGDHRTGITIPRSWPMRVCVIPPVRRSRRRIDGCSAPPVSTIKEGDTGYQCVLLHW